VEDEVCTAGLSRRNSRFSADGGVCVCKPQQLHIMSIQGQMTK